MRKVLVTGADGFIGSHLTEYLVEQGYSVVAMCQYNSFNNWGWLEGSKYLNDIEVICGDVRDPSFCRKSASGVNAIYHLAALIAIPYSYIAPSSYIDTNVKGTLNICQAALDNNVDKVLHTSTSEVYGTAKYVPIDEQHPLQPQSPYSASKIGADSIAQSYFLSFGLPVVTARPFNTYGPRQSSRAVIPAIISQLAAGKKEISLGDLSPTRDFNFVEDTVGGIVALGNSEEAVGKSVNIGSGREISIGKLFDSLNQIMGAEAKVKLDAERLRPENSEVQRLLADNSLLREISGYEPKFGLMEGLEKTALWFTNEENLKKYKTNLYNV